MGGVKLSLAGEDTIVVNLRKMGEIKLNAKSSFRSPGRFQFSPHLRLKAPFFRINLVVLLKQQVNVCMGETGLKSIKNC